MIRVSKKLVVRILVTAILVGAICLHIDFEDFSGGLKLVSLRTVVVASLFYTLGQIISAAKWRLFLEKAGMFRGIFMLNHAYFLGMFINTFGLGTVGGDVARALLLKPDKDERAGAFASVIADRVHGLAVLLIIGAVAIIAMRPGVLGNFEVILAVLGILATLVCWFGGAEILHIVANFLQSKKSGHDSGDAPANLGNFRDKILSFADDIALTFKLSHLNLAKATLLSVIMHFMHIYMYYIIATSLGVHINFSYLCVIVPVVNVASSLPISINGIGVRESLLILLSAEQVTNAVGTAPIAPETAVLTGILFTLIVTLVSGIGGIFCSLVSKWK